MRKWGSLLLSMLLAGSVLSGCGTGGSISADSDDSITTIQLSDNGVTVNGAPATDDETAAVYTANDIVFYLAGQDFTYGEGTSADEHSQAEADAHTVVHITQPGTYSLSGELSAGQIAVDLGEESTDDPAAVVTLILNGVSLTCTVAPAVIFYNVYECGSADVETAVKDVDTSAAGANVIIADGTVNNITGSYVARIYKPDSVELNEDGTAVTDAKKLHKYDGAFYSKMSMNVDGGELGSGVLNITAENEGLDSELHLTINGGCINITSGNDGINTNEDNVSVTTINGGALNIQVTGETGEGDGIDSNGWLVINGGTVISAACSFSGDAGIDAEMGIYLNGGTIAASGNMLDRIESGGQNYAVFSFVTKQAGGTTYTLKDAGGQTAGEWTPVNDYTYLVISSPDLTAGTYTLWQGETQMACSAASGDMDVHGMDGGMRPGDALPDDTVPDGEMPPKDIERPEGEPAPEDDERPPRGGDGAMLLPDGTEPSLPEREHLDGDGRPGKFNEGQPAEDETVTEFVIEDGGSVFRRIGPVEI